MKESHENWLILASIAVLNAAFIALVGVLVMVSMD